MKNFCTIEDYREYLKDFRVETDRLVVRPFNPEDAPYDDALNDGHRYFSLYFNDPNFEFLHYTNGDGRNYNFSDGRWSNTVDEFKNRLRGICEEALYFKKSLESSIEQSENNFDYQKNYAEGFLKYRAQRLAHYHMKNGYKGIMTNHLVHFGGFEKDADFPSTYYALFIDLRDEPRLSYFCIPSKRGQGLASEGYQALVRAFSERGIDINFAEVPVDNKNSIKFLLRNGFRAAVSQGPTTNPNQPSHLDTVWMRRAPIQDQTARNDGMGLSP